MEENIFTYNFSAMKKLLIKISFILIPIFLISLIVEISIRNVPNDYSYKNEYLQKHSGDIEILVLGSSHSFFGVNPEFFSLKAFNASNFSQSLDYDYFIFNKFKENLKKLRYIFLPISYFTLFSNLEDGVEDFRVKDYVIYYDAPVPFYSKYRLEVLNSEYLKLIKRTYKNFTSEYSEITCSNLGFGRKYKDKKQKDLEITGDDSSKRHTYDSFDKLEHNLLVLNKLIEECERLNIKIILFTPPSWKTYYEKLNGRQLYIMESSCLSLAEKHANVSYYNYLKDSRFDIEDFHDADHLNDIGAKKFTLILEKIISDI